MPTNYVPEQDHVIRHCPSQLCIWEDEKIVGVFPQAFELRKDISEEYLSSTWLEFFGGNRSDNIRSAIEAISNRRTVKKRHGIAVGNVGKIKSICANFGLKVRVIHEPTGSNPAYTAIRRYKSDDLSLLDALATNAWSDVVMAGDFI